VESSNPEVVNRAASARSGTRQSWISRGKGRVVVTSTTIAIVISVMLGVVGQLMLKQGMNVMGPQSLSPDKIPTILWKVATSPWVVIGLLVYVSATFFWLIALSRVELSYAYPFASLSYIFMLAASWRLMGENPSLPRLGGVALICLGVIIISQTGAVAIK
jgi:drug/metabolite transporter (DMT)-like permease